MHPHGGTVEITGRATMLNRISLAQKERKDELILLYQAVNLWRIRPRSNTGIVSSRWHYDNRICPFAWVRLLSANHHIRAEENKATMDNLYFECGVYRGVVF